MDLELVRGVEACALEPLRELGPRQRPLVVDGALQHPHRPLLAVVIETEVGEPLAREAAG